VPLSLVGTFGAMYAMNFSLNNLTLMALTISTGFVVDDAIVMIENITRYVEQGEKPLAAALKGAEQIGFTIMSLTVSLIAVLIPLLFMGDITGRLFREFAVTLSATIVISAAVSLTLTPMLCAKLLRHRDPAEQGRFYRASERVFQRVVGFYERTLDWVLARRTLTLLVAVGTLLLTFLLLALVPKGFFPVQDTGEIQAVSEAAQTVSFAKMSQLQQQLAAKILENPAVDSLSSFIGVDGTNTTLNTGRIQINLKPFGGRRPVTEVIGELQQSVASLSDINLYMQPVEDITVADIVSRTEYQYSLQDPDAAELSRYADSFVGRLKQLPELTDVASDQQTEGRQALLAFDRPTAARLGITPQNIDDALYDGLGQRQVSTLFTQLNQYHLIMEVQPEFRRTPANLNDIYVHAGTGPSVPLSAITRASEVTAPILISHMGQFPATTVSFNLAPGASLGEAVSAIDRIVKQLPAPAALVGTFQGTAQAFVGSLSNEGILILSALVTVYIVLGVLYESYIHPITILSTLPSAGVGALLALLVVGDELTVVAIIGIVLLIGIVQKNAIMMIDFALEAQRREQKPAFDAIREACLLRFRPILMTTMAAMLGAMPLAFGHGVGSELRRPLGITIVGGLIFSQLLTLYTTPVVYLFFDGLAERLAAWRRRRAPPDPGPPADGDPAAHGRGGARRRRGVSRAAPVAAAAGGFSHRLGAGLAARRQSRDHGLFGGHAARAGVRPHRGSDRDDFAEHARPGEHHAAVRPLPQHRCGDARRGVGHQCGAQLSAGQPAEQSDLPQGQSGRRAHHDHRPHLGQAAAAGAVRCGIDHFAAASVADRRGRSGAGGRQFGAGRADRRESDPARRLRAAARERAQRRRRPDRE
jgi:multidrug efflux pump